ncbi:hypothetical protein Q5O24_15035 [Eubacteriaceae bacterium ES3]|nr:hypothetical protein Q5O24_15035 [Eubacteriaceae bacterium ES3]
MKKIRSGQSFLYREDGYSSTVIDICMKDRIRGSYLSRALDKALQRYPYFNSKLVEKNGEYYLEDNTISMIAVKTAKSRVLGSMSTGYHLLDVTYTDNKICVAFHHALCDGLGIKPFVETLIYYYCCLKYNKTLDSSGIRLAGDPFLVDETDEPYGTEFSSVDQDNVFEVSKDGFRLPENAEEKENHYRTEIYINQEQFIAFSKANKATPAIFISLLASKNIKQLYPLADKPIVCSIATDYREPINKPNTHKNCVGSIYLPYSDETEKMSLAEQAGLYHQLMKQQKSPDSVKASLNSQIGLYNKLDSISGLDAKKEMMSFFNDICIDTYVSSYLGQFLLDSCRDYIKSMHLYSSGTRGLIINMISVGNCITLDILQHFESDKFVKRILSALDEINVDYSASEGVRFENRKDSAYSTASWQAEKFYKIKDY